MYPAEAGTDIPHIETRTRASAPVLPGGAGARTRVVMMVLFTNFSFPLYHSFLRPVKLTMLLREKEVT